MKPIKSDLTLAQELQAVIEERRLIEKREANLKNYWKTRLENLGLDSIMLGGVLISLSSKSRNSLDRKALVAAFGEDGIKAFDKITKYIQLDVRLIKEQVAKKAA